LDVWGGLADSLCGVSLTGEKAGQFHVATAAVWEALHDWPAEHVALWRLAVWARGMADELEARDVPTIAQFFARGGTEADENLVGAEACGLLREVFGDPFHTVRLDPIWRDPGIRELAAAANGDPVEPLEFLDVRHLAALANVIEAAGGDNAEIVSHLREPGPHVRGCWAVDLLRNEA
jgi:hypothetical protein